MADYTYDGTTFETVNILATGNISNGYITTTNNISVDGTVIGSNLNIIDWNNATTVLSNNSTDWESAAGVYHTQNTDTTLGSGAVAADHGTGTTDQIINVCYNTSSNPPAANTTTEGTLYIQYTV